MNKAPNGSPYRSNRLSVTALGVAIAALFFAGAPVGRAQLSKASQILANRGVELQGMVQWDDFFHLSVYTNMNYTSVNFFYTGNPSLLGPAPGFPWGRWVTDPTQMPPQTEQGPTPENTYMSQLLNLELADELNLNDGPTRTNEINWFNSVRSNYPNTILYINNYGGQISDASLGDMIAKGQPDMICFDAYPFMSQYNTSYANSIGPPNNWPFTTWLGNLWRYRQWGISAGIPFATYMQTFNSVESYDSIVYRNPSASELRYNISVALAFNAKMLMDFTYNSGATALFFIDRTNYVGYSGDLYTNSLTAEKQDANLRAVHLGRTLACLKPIFDLHNTNDVNPPPGPASGNVNFPDGATTSILILKGNPGTTTNTPEPVGFVDNPAAPSSYSWWEFKKNDPYLNGWTVINKGTNNGGVPGQVFISWFKPLDENFDGPAYTNEIYFMVVNALTSNSGTAADCLQEIKLNFQTGTNAITAVNLLDPETGLVITTNMPIIAGTGTSTKRQLVLDLNGGDAALFKFADGAPFIGHVAPAPAQLSAHLQGSYPAITFQGTSMARYQLQSTPALLGGGWTPLGSVLLTNTAYTFVDTSSPNAGGTYYRVVGIP